MKINIHYLHLHKERISRNAQSMCQEHLYQEIVFALFFAMKQTILKIASLRYIEICE